MLLGLLIVVFAFGLAQPITQLANTTMRSALGIAIAVVLLAFLMMITRRKAMSQVIGFLSMENGLFFGAMSATYGMPMVVELGVALDVLVAMLVLGVATCVAYVAYTLDARTISFFGTDRLVYSAPFVALGVTRFLFLALWTPKDEPPTEAMLKDPWCLADVVAATATILYVIYV